MLIIGRRKPYKNDNIGGVVVLYELFLDYFEKKGIEYDDIDLNWRNYQGKITFLTIIYFRLAKSILFSNHQKILFHGTTIDFTYYAPLVVLLSKITKKRVTLRKFGGSFDQYYNQLPFIQKKLVNYALINADCVFYETKYLVSKFSWTGNSTWFPNVREAKVAKSPKIGFQKKFVFISHVKETKGVNIILEAVTELPEDYRVDIYGPKKSYHPPSHLNKYFKKCYKGVLEPYEVTDTLAKYNVLLLPTFHEGEGYPGIILEAYAQGVPVITTKWRSIPEIVEDGKTGFLIKPKSSESLLEAVNQFNSNNYEKFSENSLEYFENFDQEKVMQRILKII